MSKEQIYYPLDQQSQKEMMLFLVLNTLLSIFSINSMTANLRVGLEVMITIMISLVSFLIAIRLQNYTPGWSGRALILGIVQIGRLIILPSLNNSKMQITVQILLGLTGVYLIFVSLKSASNQKKRNEYLDRKLIEYNGGQTK